MLVVVWERRFVLALVLALMPVAWLVSLVKAVADEGPVNVGVEQPVAADTQDWPSVAVDIVVAVAAIQEEHFGED